MQFLTKLEYKKTISKKVKKWVVIWLPIFIFALIALFLIGSALFFATNEKPRINLLKKYQNYQIIDDLLTQVMKIIFAVAYQFIITPIIYVLSGMQQIILVLSGGELVQKLLFQDNEYSPVKFYLVMLGIALILAILILIIKSITTMFKSKNTTGEIRGMLRRTLFAFSIIVFVPFFFFLTNTLITLITNMITTSMNLKNQDIGVMLFNCSFTDGIHNWEYVPKTMFFSGWSKFQPLICILAMATVTYVLFISTLYLFWRAGEIFLYYVLSPLVIFSAIENAQRLNNLKNLIFSRFFGITMVFISYSMFISAQGILLQVSNLLPNNLFAGVFMICGTIAFGLLIPKSPAIVNSILGNSFAVNDGIQSLFALKTVSTGINIGAKLGAGAIIGGATGVKGLTNINNIKQQGNLTNSQALKHTFAKSFDKARNPFESRKEVHSKMFEDLVKRNKNKEKGEK